MEFMALEMSDAKIAIFTGTFDEYFRFNCQDITVNKESVRVISTNSNPSYGYGGESSIETYNPVYNSFSGVIIYPSPSNPKSNYNRMDTSLKVLLNEGSTYVKVRQNARDYIQNGKTENIVFDNSTWNLVSPNPIVQKFLDLRYYYFEVKSTY